MKKKLLLCIITLTLTALLSAPLASAAPAVNVYGYTDKPQYRIGETVTVKYWIYNWGPEDIVLKNITIHYPWFSPIWGGNNTIKSIDQAIGKGKNWSSTETFTIPTDGRAENGNVDVMIVAVYAYGSLIDDVTSYIPFNMASAPAFAAFENMDRLMTLFTVLVVLVIVCTFILAGTIFLAKRGPRMTWKEPEKTS